MARKIKNIKTPLPSVAIVVDGETEQRYIEQAKRYYGAVRPTLRGVQIKPEKPDRKKIDDLFKYAKEKLNEGFSHVILIVDFDEFLDAEKPKDEFEKFKKYYQNYLLAKEDKPSKSQKRTNGWMANMTLVVNNPCLEYWYLLHLAKSNVTKFYARYKPELEKDLQKLPGFKDYSKHADFYAKSPDIFTRLGGLDGLKNARSFKDQQQFNINNNI